MTFQPAWRQFRRSRASWGITLAERVGTLYGGIRLVLVALLDPRVTPRQAAYLLNMGARACGCALNRADPKRTKP